MTTLRQEAKPTAPKARRGHLNQAAGILVGQSRIISPPNRIPHLADQFPTVYLSCMDTSFLSPLVQTLLAEYRTCALDAGQPNILALPILREMKAEDLFSVKVRDRDAARCCLAGLWLYHDYLDESHEISQDIHTPSGSFWHGIMHRREPDPSNAAYWFRRVGEHPIFGPLAKAAQGTMDDVPLPWSPFWFIDRCTNAMRLNEPDAPIRLVQKYEWELLFDFCCREAVSS